MNRVVIIGAGAAGLIAGIAAAGNGAETTIIEKMRNPGKKMLITGKGRCNITNSADISEFIKNIPGNGRFLNSALRQFTNEDIIFLLENNGVQTKVERGNRVFPVSDKAKDVVDALVRAFENLGGKLVLDTRVADIIVKDGMVTGVKTSKGNIVAAEAVIVATGGASYPGTGSDGKFCPIIEKLGHSIVALKPSLVPLEIEEGFVENLQGLALKNVTATILSDGKKVASEFGEMLFTHFGVSGPIVLSLSQVVAKEIAEGRHNLELVIDFKPALTEEKLDARIQRDFKEYSRKQVLNGIKDLLPQRLLPIICDNAYLDQDKFVNQVSKEERLNLVKALKHFSLPIVGTRPLAEAIVTAGGVNLKEIDPKTMQSKLIEGLYFAGEVMDVDGYTGGYNLQAAYSSGYVAGSAAGLGKGE